MPVRRSFATTTAALLLGVPLLSSCGFNLSTDRVSDNVVGLDNRSGSVDILAAVVVAAQPGSGTFIATLSNKDDMEAAEFDTLLGAGGNTIVPGDFEPITIAPRGFVNLADGGGVKITGSFGAGDLVPLSLGFADGETLDVDVPVVTACEEYLGLDPAASPTASPTASPGAGEKPAASPSAAAEPSGTASDSPTDTATLTPTATPTTEASANPSESAAASADAYSCDYAPSTE